MNDTAKAILKELRRTLGRSGGPLQVASVALGASTSDADLVAAPTGRRIFVVQADLVLAGASTLDIWSGASGDATRCIGGPGTITGLAGVQYVFGPFYTEADGDALVVDRGTSVALSGTIHYLTI